MRRAVRPIVLLCRGGGGGCGGGGVTRLVSRSTRTTSAATPPSVCIKRNASSSASQNDGGKRNAWEAIVRPIPVGLGLATIAAIGMYHALKRDIDEARHPPPLEQFEADVDFDVVAAPTPFTPSTVELLGLLPLRGISRLWGAVNEWEGPTWLMQLVLRTYSKAFGCRLDEMREPSLESFANLQQFFTRRLRDGVRPIAPSGMASPVDGRVMSVGVVEDDHHAYQIKGMRYSIPALLGEPLPSATANASANAAADRSNKSTKLLHVVLYLAPGDYHGIHAPVDCSIAVRRHVPGHLFPVAPEFVRRVAGLFAVNERVVLSGNWDGDKFFTLTPVGATNVGSITVSFDPALKTNLTHSRLQKAVMLERYFEQPVELKKGEEVAFFRLGSTVVLVFEAPNDFEFTVKPGQRVKLGQLIGDVSSSSSSRSAGGSAPAATNSN